MEHSKPGDTSYNYPPEQPLLSDAQQQQQHQAIPVQNQPYQTNYSEQPYYTAQPNTSQGQGFNAPPPPPPQEFNAPPQQYNPPPQQYNPPPQQSQQTGFNQPPGMAQPYDPYKEQELRQQAEYNRLKEQELLLQQQRQQQQQQQMNMQQNQYQNDREYQRKRDQQQAEECFCYQILCCCCLLCLASNR